MNNNNFLFNDISSLKGVGLKLKKYLKKKKIEKIKDLLFDLPYEVTDRSKISELNNLEIGKIANIKVNVIKYNFPRIRNLPNKVICSNNINKINIIFFNSNEYYIRKILPLKKTVIISGKISYYKNSYQITNPTYIAPYEDKDKILKIFPKYSLTDGLTEKTYRKLINNTLDGIKDIDDWYNNNFLKKNKFNKFLNTFKNLHNANKKTEIDSDDYRRLAYDEIFANLLMLMQARKIVRIQKKEGKDFSKNIESLILKNFPYELTLNQKLILKELDSDIKSKSKMFRLIQGDVGSGKTILSLILAAKVCSSKKYQVAYMAPTEILSKQQYISAKKLFKFTKIKIDLLTRSTPNKKEIIDKLRTGEIDLVVGTHSLFQKKIKFKNLGLIIIDEQHKFGVKQRISLSKKGGANCDVLLMSATPIPRTMMMSIYGDLDISRLTERPHGRKDIQTYVKPDKKISDIIPLLKKQIKFRKQIFWVCPLIEESNKLEYTAAVSKFNSIKKIFPNQVGLIHGGLSENDKDTIIKKFLNKKINILVSTTVIEVGVDVPNANTILIENSNKFGLSQLHQLRGRVGRGNDHSICILLYKDNLSNNAKKRLKILKSTNDGFKIAEEDLFLRGHGDILGFQQSGIKNFKFADPIHHKDLFELAEKEVKKVNPDNLQKYENLLKFYDRAEVITIKEN